MSVVYRQKDFTESAPFLVLNEPCWPRSPRRPGLGNSAFAGILARCRTALKHARAHGFPVAFVNCTTSGSRWISQLEPARTDMLFERRAASIYSSPYFHEVTKQARPLVFAGFFRAGCTRTIVDGLLAGRELLFLRDAIETSQRENRLWLSMISSAEIAPGVSISACTTSQWLAAAGQVSVTASGLTTEERGEP